jgi:signal transduction histidine kinase/ActR/RegA family two-component response regulator
VKVPATPEASSTAVLTHETERSSRARLASWRENILDAILRVAFVASMCVLLVTLPAAIRVKGFDYIARVAAFTLVVAGCTFIRGHVRARARVFLGAIAAYEAAAPYFSGLTGGVGVLAALSVVIAVLVLSRRDAIVLAGFILAAWWAWWAQLRWGLVAPPPPEHADTGRPYLAFGICATASAVVPLCLMPTDYLIRKLVETLGQTETLIAELRAKMGALEAEMQRRREAENKLWDAQRMELVGRLAGGIAHDINNNLTVIQASAALIGKKAPPEELRELGTGIVDACENAATLTRRLLAIGRRDVTRREILPVAEVLEQCKRNVRPALGASITIDVRAADEVVVNVDRGQFLQAVLNLAINARDAMPEGGALGIVAEHGGPAPAYDRLSSGAAPTDVVRIHVTDTGTGISHKTLDRIFEPFFTTKRVGQGTGLGLPMVCAFVESNGGRLGIRTRPGSGSTFTLELPAAVRAAATAGRSLAARPGATILVVDDDARVRSIVATTLEAAGYRVIDVAGGEDALALARNGDAVDLLCTDARMPGMSGEALVRRFRAEHPQTPILVCSAYVDDASLRAWIEAEAVAAVRKPFAPADLEHAVAQALASTPRELPAESVGTLA